jgi:hypothetical protein
LIVTDESSRLLTECRPLRRDISFRVFPIHLRERIRAKERPPTFINDIK